MKTKKSMKQHWMISGCLLAMLVFTPGFQVMAAETAVPSASVQPSVATTVEIAADAVIIAQPVSQSAVAGGTAVFTVTLQTSGDASYQWYVIDPATGVATALEGADQGTLSLSDIALSDNGKQFYCVVTSGSTSLQSEAATLTVAEAKTVFAINASSENTSEGTVTASAQQAEADTSVEIKATAAEGYAFDHWTVNGVVSDSTDAVLTLTGITQDTQVVGSFKKIEKPVITTETLPNGRTGVYYGQKIEATGTEPVSWSLTGNVPDGWTIDAATGLLQCESPASGTVSLVVQASNQAGTISRHYELQVMDSVLPVVPVIDNTTDTEIHVMVSGDQELSIDGGATWQSDGVFTGLMPATSYTVLTRILGQTDTASVEATTKAASPDAPATPVLSNLSDTSFSVNTESGQEYSIDGGATWQSTGLFTGLKAGNDYSVVTRTAQTPDTVAGQISSPLKVTTATGSVSTGEPGILDKLSSETATTIWDDVVSSCRVYIGQVGQWFQQLLSQI